MLCLSHLAPLVTHHISAAYILESILLHMVLLYMYRYLNFL